MIRISYALHAACIHYSIEQANTVNEMFAPVKLAHEKNHGAINIYHNTDQMSHGKIVSFLKYKMACNMKYR